MFLQNGLADVLNETEWGFPLAECIHIGGMAIGVGSIALVDFRLLNLGLREEKTAQILRYTELWTIAALVFVAFSGLALFSSMPGIYRVNQVFPAKMYVLGTALLYNFGHSGNSVGSGHKIEAAAVKVDGGNEVLRIAESAGCVLHPLDL
jgi:hypothetical protein